MRSGGTRYPDGGGLTAAERARRERARRENDPGNLAARTADALADLTRTRQKKMQYRPDLLDGFTAETGLTWTPP